MTSKNILLVGPGGHAKSEFVSSWAAARELTPFVQACGEGLTEDRLYGGLNFAALNAGSDARIEWCLERSFSNHEFVVLEELLDAPASVLLSLKDTLTSREVRNGAQRAPLQTRCLVALTNKTPQEITEMGPSQAALMERFPLQMEVKWDSYDAESYEALFQAVLSRPERVLAEVIASAVAGGAIISPRTAIHAAQVLAAGTWEDLAFVPGLANVAQSLHEQVRAAEAREAAGLALASIKERLGSASQPLTPIQALKAAKAARSLTKELETLSVPDSMVEERKTLLKKVSLEANTLIEAALELTR